MEKSSTGDHLNKICKDQRDGVSSREDQPVNIFIWDMDETLILFKSLLDGTFAEAFNGSKDADEGRKLGKHWENRILQVCDELFLYDQIENYNEPFLHSLREFDDGCDLSDYDFSKDNLAPPCDDSNKRKLAYRHRVIAQKYSQGLYSMLDSEKISLWNDLYDLTDSYTDGWLTSAHAFLKQISSENTALIGEGTSTRNSSASTGLQCQNINVVVTSGSLVPSLVKCLLFRLDDVIPHENVYSSWDVGKLQCFSWIKERFSGPSVRFCVVGDGMEECTAAEKMSWPFVSINFKPNSTHRLPGLTTKTLGYYMDVVYGASQRRPR